MPQTPSSSSNQLVPDGFNKLEWYKKIGIFGKEPLEATPQVIAEALKRAGDIVRERYGENVFQGQLGPKIQEDLKNLKVGSEFRIVEKDFLIVITGAYTGYRVEVGFSREQPKIAFVEGKSRINAGLGLKFLGAGD